MMVVSVGPVAANAPLKAVQKSTVQTRSSPKLNTMKKSALLKPKGIRECLVMNVTVLFL